MTGQTDEYAMIRPWSGTTDGPDEQMHLVMCPFAGGSSSAFRHWQQIPSAETGLTISLVTYPGRDQLRQIPPLTHMTHLAKQLADEICRHPSDTTARWLIGGHSMGAQVAFATCAILEQRQRAPAGLIISGCHAPHLQARRRLSHLDDETFIRELSSMGGCDEQLLHDPSLLPLFMPLLRADFQATESYQLPLSPTQSLLKTPTLLLYGSQDQEAWLAEVAAWNQWCADTEGPVAIPGEHFYPILRPRAFFTHVLNRFQFSDS